MKVQFKKKHSRRFFELSLVKRRAYEKDVLETKFLFEQPQSFSDTVLSFKKSIELIFQYKRKKKSVLFAPSIKKMIKKTPDLVILSSKDDLNFSSGEKFSQEFKSTVPIILLDVRPLENFKSQKHTVFLRVACSSYTTIDKLFVASAKVATKYLLKSSSKK